MMAKRNFQQPLLKSLVSHNDNLGKNLICWFGTQVLSIIII